MDVYRALSCKEWEKNLKKRIKVAMSGGVDSAVAAYLCLQKGYEVIGVTFRMFDDSCPECLRGAYKDTAQSIEDAAAICDRLNIKHEIADLSELFRRKVIDGFVNSYESGETPNPCIFCNKNIKFCAEAIGLEDDCYYATGHYARAEYDNTAKRYYLRRARSLKKDQSYVLYNLSQDILSRLYLPLGDFEKEEVRTIAAEMGFVNAHKHDSQDICFVPDGDYARFLTEYTGHTYEGGEFTDTCGRVLGKHKGQIYYTIGQRRGLGLSLPSPLYVGGRDIDNNRIILCTNEELFKAELEAVNTSFCSIETPAEGTVMRCLAKIRYAHEPQPATVVVGNNSFRVVFDEPQRAITPGQSVVLYDGDIVLGGGIIKNDKAID